MAATVVKANGGIGPLTTMRLKLLAANFPAPVYSVTATDAVEFAERWNQVSNVRLVMHLPLVVLPGCALRVVLDAIRAARKKGSSAFTPAVIPAVIPAVTPAKRPKT